MLHFPLLVQERGQEKKRERESWRREKESWKRERESWREEFEKKFLWPILKTFDKNFSTRKERVRKREKKKREKKKMERKKKT